MNDFYDSQKKTNLAIYQKISKLIQSTIKNPENNNTLISGLKKNINNLKLLNLIETRFKIETEKYEHPVYFLYQDDLEIINKYCYYAKLIGYIDASIAFFIKGLAFETENKNSENLKYIKNNLKDLNDKRDIITNEIEKSYKNIEDKILIDTLKHFPSYEKFNDLYKYYNNDFSPNCILTQFVNSYNVGYSSVYNNEKDEIFKTHNKLQKSLKKQKRKNLVKYNNTAVVVRAKKFH